MLDKVKAPIHREVSSFCPAKPGISTGRNAGNTLRSRTVVGQLGLEYHDPRDDPRQPMQSGASR
jgi:hypothetical protein